jgi:branched-chain amino acid transport system ATP-binding protein
VSDDVVSAVFGGSEPVEPPKKPSKTKRLKPPKKQKPPKSAKAPKSAKSETTAKSVEPQDPDASPAEPVARPQPVAPAVATPAPAPVEPVIATPAPAPVAPAGATPSPAPVGPAGATPAPVAPVAPAVAVAPTDEQVSPPAPSAPSTLAVPPEPATAGPEPVQLPPSIVINDLRAAYGRIEVLHGVNLVVPPGSVFALLGPNGAGKSTLLRVVNGRMRPSSGEVLVGDVPVGKRPTEKLVKSGLCAIPEGRGIFPNLTVRENLRIWTYRGGITMRDVEEQTFATFPRLKERRKQMAGTLSGGEQQMLAISRALVTRPKVLLLDELSMGLAPLIVNELYELVGTLADQGITILLVEQFVTTALAVATRAAIMVHGRIEQEGTPREMADAALSAYLA